MIRQRTTSQLLSAGEGLRTCFNQQAPLMSANIREQRRCFDYDLLKVEARGIELDSYITKPNDHCKFSQKCAGRTILWFITRRPLKTSKNMYLPQARLALTLLTLLGCTIVSTTCLPLKIVPIRKVYVPKQIFVRNR